VGCVPAEILILGGGYGGLSAARKLERRLGAEEARITLVNDVNFMLFTPLLPGAAGGTLEPRHVVVPLREELKRTQLRLGRVESADPARRVVSVCSAGGDVQEHRYDQLIVALGSTSRTLPIPGLAEHAIGFKTLPEAIALRNRLVRALEEAEVVDDEERRRALLTFVVIGAGYAGLEGIAELQDFAAHVCRLYPRSSVTGMRFVLVEARDHVMPEIGPSLQRFAEKELRRRGIELRLATTLDEVLPDGVRLSDGDTIRARTVCWTAGVKPVPAVARLGLPLGPQGRIVTGQDCRVEGVENVWAIGDAAAVPDPANPANPSPPTAQHGLRQGKLVAKNVAAVLHGKETEPFTYNTLGVFVDMGRYKAVAETMGIRWRGFPAWFLARSYHLFLMPGIKRRLRVVTDWTVDLFFSRDSSELGQLGHPQALEEPRGLTPPMGGGSPQPTPEGSDPSKAAA
jgi:NADH:ubiquinone reductase (H+-translocating)